MKVVSDADEVAGVARALARAPLAAFDLEFASADRLVPVLCLVQVAWLPDHVALDASGSEIVAAEPEIRLVDPLAVDAGPIVRALEGHPLVIGHAPRQDLGILAQRFEASVPGLVDTQLMAAFSGIGDQVGLAALVSDLLGVTLAKEQQWTDWVARPLTAEQLAYAAADVRHLPALYAQLAARLGPRVAWVREETARIAADALAAARVTPETAWEQVSGARAQDPSTRAAIVELAAWRQQVAIELDRPLGQVLAERTLVDLARQRPRSAQAIRQMKGMSPLAKTRADELAAALARASAARTTRSDARTGESGGRERGSGARTGESGGRERGSGARTGESGARLQGGAARTASSRAQRWSELLLAIVQRIADDAQIAPRLLATRADIEELARSFDEGGLAAAERLPAFASWRRDVLGTPLREFLLGRLAIVVDPESPHGFRLEPRG